MSCQLRDDNIVVIDDGGNTLTDPSTTNWGNVCEEMRDPNEDLKIIALVRTITEGKTKIEGGKE